jgi:hypothetical protein
MVDIMQWFSIQDKEFKAHVTWKHIFQEYASHIPISRFKNKNGT